VPSSGGPALQPLARAAFPAVLVPAASPADCCLPGDDDGAWFPSDEELRELVPDLAGELPDEPDDVDRRLAAEALAADALAAEAGDGPGVVADVLPGLLPRHVGNGHGFDAGGVVDQLPPGVTLAGLAGDAWNAGLHRLGDDELAGLMLAWRRLSSWATAGEMAAVAELDRRRTAQVAAGADPHLAEHVADELALVLRLTGRAAAGLLDFAASLDRLPLTRAALAAGEIDRARAYVITDEAGCLDDAHAALVEAAVMGRAGQQTTGQLRAATRRAVLAADPSAARRRQEKARTEARVEVWDERSGTAALAGRDLPPADVLAADQRISALARRLKASGQEGTLAQLRAAVYTALLLGRPLADTVPPGPAHGGTTSPASAGQHTAARADTAGHDPAGPARTPSPGTTPADTAGHDPAGPAAALSVNTTRPSAAGHDPAGPARTPSPGTTAPDAAGQDRAAPPGVAGLAGLGGSVNLTMPLLAWLGREDEPGEVAGFGPVPAGDARAIAGLLAARPGARWCITLTDRAGRAIAHGCAATVPAVAGRAGPAPPPDPRFPPRPLPSLPVRSPGQEGSTAGPVRGAPSPEAGTADPVSDAPGPGVGTADPVSGVRSQVGDAAGQARGAPSPGVPPAWALAVTIRPLAVDGCDHQREGAGYRAPASLRHLIEIRQRTCSFPSCRRPASDCDQDHTVPFERGGRTCECGLAPLCRRHHRAKQAQGWHLTQPQPGVLRWRTPHGRSYGAEPDPYPGELAGGT
jgi:hypothetical protein